MSDRDYAMKLMMDEWAKTTGFTSMDEEYHATAEMLQDCWNKALEQAIGPASYSSCSGDCFECACLRCRWEWFDWHEANYPDCDCEPPDEPRPQPPAAHESQDKNPKPPAGKEDL
jgi:hypothetical protein